MSSQTSPQEVAERALAASASDGCVVVVREATTVNLRWAGNTLTTNGLMRTRELSVVATVDGAEGTSVGVVSTNRIDHDVIERTVALAEAAARRTGPAEDAQPLVLGGPASSTWSDAPADTSTAVFEQLAPDLGAALGRSRAEGRELFGFAEHDMTTTYLAQLHRVEAPPRSTHRKGRDHRQVARPVTLDLGRSRHP